MLKRIIGFSTHNIYYKSPVFMQHVFTSVYGYKLRRERYNRLYRKAFKGYVRGGTDKRESLAQLIHHLKNNIQKYRNIEIDQEDLMESFLKLPVTVKADLRYELEERSFKEGILRMSRTGGTTGENLVVYDSEHDRARRMAYLDYIKWMNGIEPFSRRASFTGQELTPHNHKNKLWRYNWSMNQILYTSLYMTHENIHHVYESLARSKPVSLDGIPSSLHMLARHILKHDLTVDWGMKAIFPTAETLLPHVKSDIEKAFNAMVIDQYSSSEGAPFIYSTKDGTYRIGDETGLIEFHKAGRHLYDMVVTSFINNATPIVRYKIGDQVEIKSQAEYLNSYQDDIQITRIIGRQAEYLYGHDGNKVTNANISWIIDGFEEKVAHIQFVQKEMNRFIINLVVDDDFDKKDEKMLGKRAVRWLGLNSHFDFNYLDTIPKEKNGKVRLIINEVG